MLGRTYKQPLMRPRPKRTPKIAKAQGRSVKEWIGKTPDERPPRYVRLRNFDFHKGVCHITGRKIGIGEAWDSDHVKRLEDGGENRESNLAPALKDPHAKKTAAENRTGAKVRKKRMAHVGLKKESQRKIESRGFEKVEREPKAGKVKIEKKPLTDMLPEIARRYGLKPGK